MPLPSSSRPVLQSIDFPPVASPPEIPPGGHLYTTPSQRSSMFERWLPMRMKKRVDAVNGDPPRMAAGKRQLVSALGRQMSVASLTCSSSERSRKTLRNYRFVVSRVSSVSHHSSQREPPKAVAPKDASRNVSHNGQRAADPGQAGTVRLFRVTVTLSQQFISH